MRIAWFSPLGSPEKSHAAFYSQLVLPQLACEATVDCFVPDADFSGTGEVWIKSIIDSNISSSQQNKLCQQVVGNYPVEIYHFHQAAELHRANAYDLFVYQFEDNEVCHFVRLFSRIWPGIKIFHDLRLNRLYRSEFKHSTGGTDLNMMMDQWFGKKSPRIGEYHVRKWPIEAFDLNYCLGSQEWHSAGVNIVFNSDAKTKIEQSLNCQDQDGDLLSSESCNVSLGSYLSSPAVVEVDCDQLSDWKKSSRIALEIEDDSFVVGFAGEYFLEDRCASVCQAISSANAAGDSAETRSKFRMLWFVHDDQTKKLAQETISRYFPDANQGSEQGQGQSLADKPRVILLENISQALQLISACDAVFALRSSQLLSWPRIAQYAMSCRVPLVVGDLGLGQCFPPNVSFAVKLGSNEQRELTAVLAWLAEHLVEKTSVAEQMLDYVSAKCTPKLAAEMLLAVYHREKERLLELRVDHEQVYIAAERGLVSSLFERGQRPELVAKVASQESCTEDYHSVDELLNRELNDSYRRVIADFSWEN